jgi:hypothetical protein
MSTPETIVAAAVHPLADDLGRTPVDVTFTKISGQLAVS